MTSVRLGLATCVWDEAAALPAFLAYHRALGVERVYLYLDRCSDESAAIAAAHPFVTAIARADADGAAFESWQLACHDDALARARADGLDWLLPIDVDEFAWGGGLGSAAPASAVAAGDLRAMLAAVPPAVEAVVFAPLEIVPAWRAPDDPPWRQADVWREAFPVRTMWDPIAAEPVAVQRPLGHDQGKSAARVTASLQAFSAHRWTRAQGRPLPEPQPIAEVVAGHHLHYVVQDAAQWLDKYRKFAEHPEVWLRGVAMGFPKRAWRLAAPQMSLRDAERYFDAAVAVPPAARDRYRAAGQVASLPVVRRVLDEIGFGTAPPAPRGRVAFVGLDALDLDLVHAGVAAGELPVLARVLASSLQAPTVSPAGCWVGAMWTSMVTGVGPGRHGRYCWEQLVPGSYDERSTADPTATLPPAFWDALGAAGRRTAICDVPFAPAMRAGDGVQLREWGCHDPEVGFRTEPPSLADEVLAAVGPHPLGTHCNRRRDAGDFAALRDDLVAGLVRRTRLHRWLLARPDWSLLCSVYSEMHCVGHQCWHLHDPRHRRYDPGLTRAVGSDPVREVLRALDRSLGDLLAGLGAEATVLLWASSGMRPHQQLTFLLDEMLAGLELAGAIQPRALRRRQAARGVRVDAEAASRRAVRVRFDVSRDDRLARRSRADSVAFQVSNNHAEGAIRLNVVGREPAGLVAAAEVDAVCRLLARGLASFVDADTGRPVVEAVVRSRDVHRGPFAGDLPDLFVRWNPDVVAARVASPVAGAVVGDYDGVRSGDHRAAGRLLLLGPHVRPGVLDRTVRVEDLAPTLSALCGVRLADVDGRVVPELLAGRCFGAPGFLAAPPA